MVLLDSRSQASQWDYGLYVLFSNDDGVTAGQEVHFASQGDGVASVVLAESTTDGIVCAIPNQLLTDSRTIRIYAYVDDGETGRTVKRWQLPVFARPKPDDYVFTETEVRRYETLSAELSAEVTARQSADTALQTAISGKQNKLTAGQNITIANNVISASGGAVSSVNGQTGPVVLSANDIGYDEESARTQPLTTVSGYINAQEEVLDTIFDWMPDGGSVGDVLTKTASGTQWQTGGGDVNVKTVNVYGSGGGYSYADAGYSEISGLITDGYGIFVNASVSYGRDTENVRVYGYDSTGSEFQYDGNRIVGVWNYVGFTSTDAAGTVHSMRIYDQLYTGDEAPAGSYIARGWTHLEHYTKSEVNDLIPTALPNPSAITFTGAVEATYDGSGAVTVNIPQGGVAVDSVNGKTGAVELDADDVGAEPEAYYVHIDPDDVGFSGDTVSIDHTSDEIYTAFQAGKHVVAIIKGGLFRQELSYAESENLVDFSVVDAYVESPGDNPEISIHDFTVVGSVCTYKTGDVYTLISDLIDEKLEPIDALIGSGVVTQ